MVVSFLKYSWQMIVTRKLSQHGTPCQVHREIWACRVRFPEYVRGMERQDKSAVCGSEVLTWLLYGNQVCSRTLPTRLHSQRIVSHLGKCLGRNTGIVVATFLLFLSQVKKCNDLLTLSCKQSQSKVLWVGKALPTKHTTFLLEVGQILM